MKKGNLLKALIVFVGVGLAYFRSNLDALLDFVDPLLILVPLILVFISAIFILNYKVYGLKTYPSNSVKRKYMDSLKLKRIKSSIVIENLLWIICAIGFGTLLGFYFKTPNARMLIIALGKGTKWKKDLFIEWRRESEDFFELTGKGYGGFEFNWSAFTMGVIGVLIIYFIIRKTTLLDSLKIKVKPFLK